MSFRELIRARAQGTAAARPPGRFGAQQLVALVLIGGLIVTAVATLWNLERVQQADREELASKGELLVFETATLLQEAGTRITATGSLFRASQHVSPFEYRTFVGDLGLLPGMLGLGYVPIVPDDELDEWLEATREEIPAIQVFELDDDDRPIPLKPRDRRFPLLYFEPVELFAPLAGLDIGYHPEWRDELLDGLEADGLTMTPFIGLGLPPPLDDDDQFLMGWPIADPDSGEVEELVLSIIDLAILTESNVSPEVTSALTWEVTDAPTGEDAPDGAWISNIEFGGQTWQYTVRLAAPKAGLLADDVLYAMLVGLIVTVLMTLLVQQLVARVQGRREVENLESLNQSKDEFLASVSHRLRTPLTSVVGFSEVLRENDATLSESDRRELVSTIAVEAIELGHLFDNLLIVTRNGESAPFTAARVRVTSEMYAVLDTADPARRSKVRVAGADPSVVAAGDPGLVRQILRNLVANAAQYGDEIELRVTADERVVRVTVCDDGPGIPPDRVRSIFHLYDHDDPDSGQPDSMGVGLFVSRSLARRMSGDLTYRRVDNWTEFELTLPAIPAAVATSADQEHESATVN